MSKSSCIQIWTKPAPLWRMRMPSVLRTSFQLAAECAAMARARSSTYQSEASMSLTHVPSSTRFVCELLAVPAETHDDLGFDDYRFAVKDRRFVH